MKECYTVSRDDGKLSVICDIGIDMADTGYSGRIRLDDGSFYSANYAVNDTPKTYVV